MKKGSLRTNGRMRFKANQRGKWWEVAERGVLKNRERGHLAASPEDE